MERSVAVDTSIVMDFNEAIDPTTVTCRTPRIYLPNLEEGTGRIMVSSDRRRVTLTPLDPLPGCTRTDSSVNAVKDLAGNTVTTSSVTLIRRRDRYGRSAGVDGDAWQREPDVSPETDRADVLGVDESVDADEHYDRSAVDGVQRTQT
jgi:hypothetical protein